jgi:hypothetical protein
MNRNQFLVLTGLSSLVILFLFLQIIFVRMAGVDQGKLMQAQQIVQQGQQCDQRVRILAQRIYNDSQRFHDQGLTDLLARQQITITAPPAGGEAAPAPAEAPAPAPAPMPAH